MLQAELILISTEMVRQNICHGLPPRRMMPSLHSIEMGTERLITAGNCLAITRPNQILQLQMDSSRSQNLLLQRKGAIPTILLIQAMRFFHLYYFGKMSITMAFPSR